MKLYLNTVSDLLWNSLNKIMEFDELKVFRLVGGTSLSLQLGHRESVDIDLFTDADYGSVDFSRLGQILNDNFDYVETSGNGEVGMGKPFFIGNSQKESIKLDLFYTDTFVFPAVKIEELQLASIEEIAAMKLEVICQGGRKKDFWDIHELAEKYSLDDMLEFYFKRYPYGFQRSEVIDKLTDFENAEYDFTPNCYKDKIWEIIKIDIEEMKEKLKPNA